MLVYVDFKAKMTDELRVGVGGIHLVGGRSVQAWVGTSIKSPELKHSSLLPSLIAAGLLPPSLALRVMKLLCSQMPHVVITLLRYSGVKCLLQH